MDEVAILRILATILKRTQSDITFWENIALESMSDQHPHPDVKLMAMDEQGSL